MVNEEHTDLPHMDTPTDGGAQLVAWLQARLHAAEQQVQQTEKERHRLWLIFEHANEIALALYDAPTATLLMANQRYLQIVRRVNAPGQHDVIGANWHDLECVPSRDESIRLWNQVIATRKPRRISEVRASYDAVKDDSVWDWTLAPIIEEGSDTIDYMLITAVEVTHQVGIREEAERLGRLKDEFLSIASHELRVPMTPLMGFADLLARTVGQYQTNVGTDDAPRVNQMVDAIQQQIRRLNRIIEDLLDVARLQSGKFSLEREQVNLGTLLAQTVAEARVIAPDQPIELHLPPDGAPVEVVGDTQRLSQIMMNLIQNAIRHAPDSSQIHVHLSTVHDATSGTQFGQIDVQDNGPGIAPEALPAIFDRFYQLEHADQPLRNGLGLGLFICKQLVEQHGGTISVQSTVGQGSTFIIRLPLAQA